MNASPATMRMTVGVLVERRKSNSPWVDFTWQPVAVTAGAPQIEPWTRLGGDEKRTAFYVGAAELELFRSETANYRDNLNNHDAVWVTLRPTGTEPPYELVAATVDPAEGESYTEAGDSLVDCMPMPAAVRVFVSAFVAENAAHEADYKFVKRKRDRADPEALARRSPIRRDDE